jgi:response regulator RpfG family c-di-GMP phosphodiesterase
MVTIIIIVLVAGIGLWYFRKKIKLGNIMSILSPTNPESEVEKCEKDTEKERNRTQELQKLLKARQELQQAKTVNRKLIKDLAIVSAGKEVRTPLPSAKLRH